MGDHFFTGNRGISRNFTEDHEIFRVNTDYGITGFWVGSVHEAGNFFHHSTKKKPWAVYIKVY